ncbi:MAG TPA: glycosyltransferase family 2 protein [Caulobacteraceae bacterium]|nr:glycosyltransferase family 2 protein [Caulobacteraceae bacterium]
MPQSAQARVVPLSEAPGRRTLSLVVPFFNEAEALPSLVRAIDAFARAAQPARGLIIDAIFVDDGSSDDGGAVLTRLAEGERLGFDLRLLRLSRNFGKEVALTAGLSAADADAVVMLDADLQHPLELIDAFLAGWLEEGYDVVFAYQAPDRQLAWWVRLLRHGFYRVINATSEVDITPDAGDFRLMTRRAYQALRMFGERQRLMKGLYGWIGFRQKGISFVAPPRAAGKTHYSPLKLSVLALEGVTAFSVAPLRLSVWVGVLLAIFAGGYGLWTVFETLYWGHRPAGYPTLAVLISMIGAAQLIFLGVIGEYLGRVLVEVKGRPLFVLESDTRHPGQPTADRSLMDA